MLTYFKSILSAQLEASSAMLGDCVKKCPQEHWDGLIGKYPFWMVAYHTLCFADLYLSPSKKQWRPRAIHPNGYGELLEEYPSRKFEKEEILEYVQFCRKKIGEAMKSETAATLQGPSGFSWYTVTRGELHVINARHISHHAGQLSAFLRRVKVKPKWVGSGWK